MGTPKVYEGTLEEILAEHGEELQGRRVRVEFEENEPPQDGLNFKGMTHEQWAQELREWAASHRSDLPPLSDEAIDRDSIYEGRG